MYRIDPQTNRVVPVSEQRFGALGYGERAHLQEWIAAAPDMLGEPLLIIQKEFAGFSDTRERLDLLALDKSGRLVVIENKLDDSGRDVVWQALKYAAYCSTLTGEDITRIFQEHLDRTGGGEARSRLQAFLDPLDPDEADLNRGQSQRIMLVAAHFRKEVTSTALWLAGFGIQLQCFVASLFEHDGSHLLDIRQIIPTPSAGDYTIRLAEKARLDESKEQQSEGRHAIRREFWALLLAKLNARSSLFSGVNPTKENYLLTPSCLPGVQFIMRVTRTYAGCELYIFPTGARERVREVYNALLSELHHIETALGQKLICVPPDNRQSAKLVLERPCNVFDKESWPELSVRLANDMLRLEAAAEPVLQSAALRQIA